MHECTSEFCRIQKKTFRESTPEELLDLGRSLKVFEHLGGKTVQKKAQREEKIIDGFVQLCQEGIEPACKHAQTKEKRTL